MRDHRIVFRIYRSSLAFSLHDWDIGGAAYSIISMALLCLPWIMRWKALCLISIIAKGEHQSKFLRTVIKVAKDVI